MEVKFDKRYWEELYDTGKTTDKKHRFQPQVANKYRKTVDILASVTVIEDLFPYNALCYEKRIGDKDEIEYKKIRKQCFYSQT